MEENRKRSVAKALSWRIIATLLTMLLVFVFTGEILISVSVGAFELVLKMVFYYVHERTWNRISWGKQKSNVKSFYFKQTKNLS